MCMHQQKVKRRHGKYRGIFETDLRRKPPENNPGEKRTDDDSGNQKSPSMAAIKIVAFPQSWAICRVKPIQNTVGNIYQPCTQRQHQWREARKLNMSSAAKTPAPKPSHSWRIQAKQVPIHCQCSWNARGSSGFRNLGSYYRHSSL